MGKRKFGIGRSISKAVKRVKTAAPKIAKALTSGPGREILQSVARQVKGVMKNYITSKCPECGAVVSKVVKNPIAKAILDGAESKLREKCKICGEVMDVVIDA